MRQHEGFLNFKLRRNTVECLSTIINASSKETTFVVYFILFYSNWFNNSIIAERQIQQTQSQALSAELIAKRTKRHLDELEVSQYYYISSLIVLLTQPFSRDPIMLNLE